MRFPGYLLPLLSPPLLASCVFLLDYDKLEGDARQAGSSGAGGSNTAPQAGAGGNDSCTDCDDHDPCTDDSCDDSGSCAHAPREGLVLDGLDETVEAEAHLRVSMVAGGQLFYLSVLEANEDVSDVTIYRLASDGAALETLEKVSNLRVDATVLSNAGLAIDPAIGGLALHGFIAMQTRLPGAEPKVFHLVSRNGKTTSTLVGPSYGLVSPWVFPQALTIGNKVVGAWIQGDGTIAVHDPGDGTVQTLGDPALPASTLSLLATANDEPAVMFTAQDETGALGSYVESVGTSRAPVEECQTAAGTYVSSSAISTQIPGVWLGNVTRAGDDYLTTGGTTLLCGNNGCSSVTDTCMPEDLSNSIRNVAGATVHFEADAPGIVYAVVAVPQLALKEGSTTEVEARLSLSLGRADFSEQGKGSSEPIGGDETSHLLPIARQPTNEAASFSGPDWPAVAILPTRQVAVAWLQPNAERSGSQLRVQRYKMCLPSD